MFYKKYTFGEAEVHFIEVPVEAKKTTVGMAVLPKGVEIDPKRFACDALIQVAFTGDETLIDCTCGMTMRGRSSKFLKVTRQAQFMSGTLNTYLSDGKGNEYVHKLSYDAKSEVFTSSVRYENRTREVKTLELFSSFSLSISQNAAKGLALHRMTTAGMQICSLKRDTLSGLGFGSAAITEKWGEVGSMPNRGFYPFAAIEHPDGYFLGVQMEAPCSWQMELFGKGEMCSLSGGLADYETGHWRRTVRPGESFETHRAFFTVQKSLLGACNALIKEQDRRISVPSGEEGMPAVYHERSRGSLSSAKLSRLLKTIKPLPIGYFVVDRGWSGNESEELDEFAETAKKIREAGLRPGIRLEYETVERTGESFEREELILKRDGIPLTAKGRCFLDLRLPEVKNGQENLLRFLKNNGIGYLKIDYSEAYGIGCDSTDAASLGEGGRRVAEESVSFLDRIKETVPDIVLENSSVGRIEPLRMSKTLMCLIPDCEVAPLIAANVSRVMPARQIQVQINIRKEDPDERTVYFLCSAMLGRICISGDIHLCTPEKFELIRTGLEFYQGIKEILRRGELRMLDCDVEDYYAPKGRQIFVKDFGNRRLVVVHFLESETAVRIPLNGYEVKASFTDLKYGARSDYLRILGVPFHAGAFLLEKGEVER